MAKSDQNTPLLRWHGWIRTRDGQITGYVKIRAVDAHGAVEESLLAALRQFGGQDKLSGGVFRLEDFVCIGVSLHASDQVKI